jgi:myo-inositol-1(or 4)-monophosphatase
MLEFAVNLARQAGALLLEGLERGPTVELKSAFEVVTEVDRASEQLIVAAIAQQFPSHSVLAEEGSGVERDSEYQWLIDPLDGTNNYAHRFPFCAVSLALLRRAEMFVGVVYDPLRDEMFSAQAGQGAWCNGLRLRGSDTPSLARSLTSTGFPYDYALVAENNLAQFDRIQSRSQGVRRAGAAALDLAYVAAGRLDAHWELGLKPWDAAAAALMVREAGGQLSDWHGQPWNPWSNTLIASNSHIHSELVDVLGASE